MKMVTMKTVCFGNGYSEEGCAVKLVTVNKKVCSDDGHSEKENVQ